MQYMSETKEAPSASKIRLRESLQATAESTFTKLQDIFRMVIENFWRSIKLLGDVEKCEVEESKEELRRENFLKSIR